MYYMINIHVQSDVLFVILTVCNCDSVVTKPSYKCFKCGLLSLTSSLGTHSVALLKLSATYKNINYY